MDKTSVQQPDPRDERLAKLEDRYRNEDATYEARAEVWDSIRKARKAIAAAKAERA